MPLQNIYPQEWKSCLETITPDSPYMLLENGEYATLPENLNFIFEVDDLENELPENIVEQVGVNHLLIFYIICCSTTKYFETLRVPKSFGSQTIMQIALISVENKKMEISHKLFTSWLNDLTLIGSEDVIKEILRRNLQKFHSLFCKALGLLQGTFPSMLAPRFVSAATSLIR